MKEHNKTLESIKQEYISIIWTHKIQETQAEIYHIANFLLRILNILIVVASTCGIVSLFFTDEIIIKIATTLLTAFSLAMLLVNYEFSFQEKEKNNKKAATSLLKYRDKFRLVIAKHNDGILQFDSFLSEAENISSLAHELYSDIPHASRLAVCIAKKRLLKYKESTVGPEEIEVFFGEGDLK